MNNQLVVEDIVGFIAREIEHPEPLIERGILPKASVAVVGGISKLGKSIFVMNMGLSLAWGRPFLGLFPVPQPRRVLYVQQEVSVISMQDRGRKMIGHMEQPPPEGNFLLINCKGLKLDGSGFGALAEVIDQHEPEVVILDPLYKLHTGDENKVQDMVRLFGQIDRLISASGATFVICHHHGKPSEYRKEGAQLLRGSSTIFDYGDSYFTLKRKSREGDRRYVELSFELRNADDPDPLTLHRNPETLWFEVVAGDSRRKVSELAVV